MARVSTRAFVEAVVKKCPACAEEIQDEAIICRFCRTDLRVGIADASPSIVRVAAPAQPATSGMAVASLVMGILGVVGFVGVFFIVFSVLALVFGYVAKGQIAQSRGELGGGGMATAGIVLGWVSAGLTLFLLLVASGSSRW